MEGAVLGATVVPEMGDDGPKDAAGQGENEQEAVLDPVHRGVAGVAGVPVGGDAGEMEEMLADELGEMVEGPVELVLDPAADDWEGLKEGSVAIEKDEAEEVEEGDAEAEAGGGAPGSGGVVAETGDSAGAVMPEGSKRDLAWKQYWMLDDFGVGRLERRKENFLWS